MTFKMATTPTYWWPVTILMPAGGDKAGQTKEFKFDVEFARLDEDEMEAFNQRIRADKPTDRKIAREIVKRFRTAAGADTPAEVYADTESIEELIRVPTAGSAIVAAFFESRMLAAEKK